MARETCVACKGTGRGSGVGGDCIVCNGMGKIWVPGPSGGSGGGVGSPTTYSSESFEEWLASLLGLASWGFIVYYGLTRSELEWYWPIIGGAIAGFFIGWLFKGPLRFILTIVKYLLVIGTIGWTIYLIYFLIKGFSAT